MLLSLVRSIAALPATLGDLLKTIGGLIADPQRRRALRDTTESGAELLRGGLPVDSEHESREGRLISRSILQLDGDVSTWLHWTPAEDGPSRPSPEIAHEALRQHFQTVERTISPLRDLASLTVTVTGSLATLLAAIPAASQLVVFDLDAWLHGAVACVLLPMLAAFVFPYLARFAAFRFRERCGGAVARLNGEGDEACLTRDGL